MELDILEKVFLLALLKRESDETINDILIKVEATGTFSMKEGKAVIKKLKSNGFIDDTGLTFTGISQAQLAEREFKL